MKQLLEAGVHFGHQTRRWNPKMAEYIFAERNGIYIIDLQKTAKKVEEAYDFVMDKEGQYEAEVYEGGTNFSGGQKQRLALAINLVANKDIYIFCDVADSNAPDADLMYEHACP